jgi:type I restriction enzyme M protein
MALKTKKMNGSEMPMTTGQALGSLIKSARDIMRKDKGLNGDLDPCRCLLGSCFSSS